MKKKTSVFTRKAASALLAALLLLPAVTPVFAAAGFEKTTAALSEDVEGEAIVLLENDGVLPLEKGKKLAVFGAGQDGLFYNGGGGSAGTNGDPGTTALEALLDAEKEGAVSLVSSLVSFYRDLAEEKMPSDETISAARKETDTALLFLSRFSSEGTDRRAVKGDYYLSEAEEKLADRVTTLFPNVIVILNLCGVTDLTRFAGEDAGYPASAMLSMWMPGQHGASALPKVLTGEINPSGKLIDTYARSYDDYPSQSFGTDVIEYSEDIYVGYRYFETFAPEKVLYPFGYGLSYTTFSFSDITVKTDAGNETVSVTLTVTNTGSVSGKEVVQVYFGHPEKNRLGYPVKELAAFRKTKLLAPGESEKIELRYAVSDMAGYDDLGKIRQSAYVLEAGDYPVYVGNSVRAAVQAGTVTVPETKITEQLTERCVSVMQLKERMVNADGLRYEGLPQREPVSAEENDALTTVVTASGVSVLEAENYYKAEGNDTLVVMNGALHNTHNKGTLYYRVKAEASGSYLVYVNTAQGSSTGKNCLTVTVNGEKQDGFVLDVNEMTASWESYRYFPCGYLWLDKGENDIEMVIRDGAAGNMESFRICPEKEGDTETADVSGKKNAIFAEGESVIEAEDYSSTTNSSLAKNPAGYLENLHLPGTITYTVYAEATADYMFAVMTGVGNEGAEDSLSVRVNGISQAHVRLGVSGTGGWDKPARFDGGYITLRAGENTITVEPAGCGNLDKLIFTRVPGGATRQMEDKEQVPESGIIPLKDVYGGKATLDAFLEQLTASELMYLVHGRGGSSQWGGLDRYGIPYCTVSDGGGGLRDGTWLPVATAQASTWNPDLLEDLGLHIGGEAWDLGVDIWLGPAMNIHRNPLCGRNFEYFSEDPLLSGKVAAALVRGVAAQGICTTLKHFCANNCDYNRNTSDSRMSERALREIYLKGFEIAVKEGKPSAVMSSYNYLNGCETSENADLLTGILRGEWGFEGLVMSDWWNDSNEAKELLAGNDLKMPEGTTSDMVNAMIGGTLTREVLKTSAGRVMTMLLNAERVKKLLDPAYEHKTVTEIKGESVLPFREGGDEPTEETPASQAGLIAGISAAAVCVAAVTAILLVKKKKSGKE
ncbi:MAG: glycoside hydrolase family 3 C-terminal domain-containing protein [Lachnospiraceae bacterium]|nr:glycoside hydrolase family 3 C-terminal domain-containing protein [Lachnospiraceae bacterium]